MSNPFLDYARNKIDRILTFFADLWARLESHQIKRLKQQFRDDFQQIEQRHQEELDKIKDDLTLKNDIIRGKDETIDFRNRELTALWKRLDDEQKAHEANKESFKRAIGELQDSLQICGNLKDAAEQNYAIEKGKREEAEQQIEDDRAVIIILKDQKDALRKQIPYRPKMKVVGQITDAEVLALLKPLLLFVPGYAPPVHITRDRNYDLGVITDYLDYYAKSETFKKVGTPEIQDCDDFVAQWAGELELAHWRCPHPKIKWNPGVFGTPSEAGMIVIMAESEQDLRPVAWLHLAQPDVPIEKMVNPLERVWKMEEL